MNSPSAQRQRIPLPAAANSTDPDIEQRRKLAEDLDAQGIYPPAWTTATRAPWSKQALYRRTGFHDSSRHFLANGELYERANNPALNPSPEQAEESLKAYLGQAAKPIHEIVPVEQVPLAHPVGQPLTPDTPEQAAAMARLLAAQNVNHETWHQGDPVPPAMQKWITANGYKTSDIYQGPDGWHYQRNERTLESPEVTKLRLAEAARQPSQEAVDIVTGTSPDPANAKVAEKILVDWQKAGMIPLPAPSSVTQPIADRPTSPTSAAVNDNDQTGSSGPIALQNSANANDTDKRPNQVDQIPSDQSAKVNTPSNDPRPSPAQQRAAANSLAAVLDKLKNHEALSSSDESLLASLQKSAESVGIHLDITKIDPDNLRSAMGPATFAAGTALAASPGIAPPSELISKILGATARLGTSVAESPETLAGFLLSPAAIAFAGAMTLFSKSTERPEDDDVQTYLKKLKAKSLEETRAKTLTSPAAPAIPTLPPFSMPPPSPEGGTLPPPPPVPQKIKPFINTIPVNEDSFIKPFIFPGWQPVPEFTDDRLKRLGSPELQQRHLECRDRGADFFEDLGYKVAAKFGGPRVTDANGENINREFYIPSQLGGVAGSNAADIGFLLERNGEKFTVLMNSYTFKPGTKLPIRREVDSFMNGLRNLQFHAANGPAELSEYVQLHYEYYKGVFAMFSKTKPGPEGDAEFQERCRETFESMVDDQGNIIQNPPQN